MSTHNICFHGQLRKISIFFVEKSSFSQAPKHCSNKSSVFLPKNVHSVISQEWSLLEKGGAIPEYCVLLSSR